MKMWECLTLGSSGQFLSLNCIQGIQGWRQEDRWEWKEVKEDVWRGGGGGAGLLCEVSLCLPVRMRPLNRMTRTDKTICVWDTRQLNGFFLEWTWCDCVCKREREREGGWSDHYSNSCVDQTHSRSCDIWIQSIWWSRKLSSSTSLIRIMQKNHLVTMITCLSACECMDFPW